MKQHLINIFNIMQNIEVKGENVVYLGQAMQQLAQVINSLPDNTSEIKENEEIKNKE